MTAQVQTGFTPGKGALATLVLVAMLNVMGGAAVAPALPAMSTAFPHASEAVVSLVITLPPLAVALAGPFVGMLADRVGKARTLVFSLMVFTVAGLWGLVAPTLEMLLVGRFVLGVAIAGIATASSALVSEYYDDDMRARVYGWQSAASGASVLVLETSGGFLSLLGWREPFLVYVVGIALLALAVLFVREPRHAPLDAATTAGIDGGSSSPGGEAPRSKGRRATKTIGPILVACLAAVFLSQTLSYLVPSKMPYLLTSFGESSLMSGLFLGGFGIANIAGSLASAPLQQRVPRSAIATGCFCLLGTGCIVMAIAAAPWAVLVGAVIIGLGVGCVTPVFVNWLASASTAENSGKHMGMFAAACSLGQFACTLLAGGVMALHGTHQAVFATGAILGLAAAAAAFALRARIDNASA